MRRKGRGREMPEAPQAVTRSPPPSACVNRSRGAKAATPKTHHGPRNAKAGGHIPVPGQPPALRHLPTLSGSGPERASACPVFDNPSKPVASASAGSSRRTRRRSRRAQRPRGSRPHSARGTNNAAYAAIPFPRKKTPIPTPPPGPVVSFVAFFVSFVMNLPAAGSGEEGSGPCPNRMLTNPAPRPTRPDPFPSGPGAFQRRGRLAFGGHSRVQ